MSYEESTGVNKSRVREIRHVARMEEKMHIQFLEQNPEGNRSFGRSRHRWQGCIKMDLKQII
jgi:hypothetical protein